MQKKSVYRLIESAMMLAIAAVLSVIKVVDMPVGGSVTLMSMLPILIIAYRYGTGWGLLTGVTYGLIQMLLGLENLSYATSFGAAVAIIVLDYLAAFTVLGLGGVFRRTIKSQGAALALGCVLGGGLRYVCHLLSGCTVWYGLSVPTGESLNYSFVYNAVYMVPELVLLTAGAVYLSKLLNFRETTITRSVPAATTSPLIVPLSVVSVCSALAAVIADIVLIVPHLQTEDILFHIGGLADVNWIAVGIVTVSAAVVVAVCTAVTSRLNKQ